MKMMNTDEFVEKLKSLLAKVSEKETAYEFSKSVDRAGEENGKLQIVFTIKNKENKKAKEFKLPMYIFEGRKHLTTFVISARTLKLLFENSTMDSPEIALHYLEDILYNEVKWIKEVEETIKKQKEAASKKRAARSKGGKKPFRKGEKPSGNFKGKPYNGGKRPAGKPSGKGASRRFGNSNGGGNKNYNTSSKQIRTLNNKKGER